MMRNAERLPVYGSYDIVVSGGGLAGAVCAAALARAGKKVALVERRSALGWEIGRARRIFVGLDNAKSVSVYIRELLDGLNEKSRYRGGVVNAPFAELIFDRWVMDAGVDVLFHGWVSELRDNGGSTVGSTVGLVVGTKEGYQRMDAPLIVETDDFGRLIGKEYARTRLRSGAVRSVLVCDCESAVEKEYTLPDGRKFTVRPQTDGLATVDIVLSAETAEERDREFYASLEETLEFMRRSAEGMSAAKVVFLAEEEWRTPAFCLAEERLFRGEPAAIGTLLSDEDGVLKPRALCANQIALPDRPGVVYAGPWLPAVREASDTEEAEVLNRMLLGEATASFINSHSNVKVGK